MLRLLPPSRVLSFSYFLLGNKFWFFWLLQQKLFYEHHSFIELKIESLLCEIVTFVLREQIPDWCTGFLQGCNHLVCLTCRNTGVVLTLNDHQWLLDLADIIEGRDAIQELSHLWISFVAIL